MVELGIGESAVVASLQVDGSLLARVEKTPTVSVMPIVLTRITDLLKVHAHF